jgi:hypothetical protein
VTQWQSGGWCDAAAGRVRDLGEALRARDSSTEDGAENREVYCKNSGITTIICDPIICT